MLHIGGSACIISDMTIAKRSWVSTAVFASLFILVPTFLGFGFLYSNSRTGQDSQREVAAEDLPTVEEESFPYTIPPRSSLYSVLRGLGVTSPAIRLIVEAAKPISDLGRISPGTAFQVYRSKDSLSEVSGIKFRFSPVEMLEVSKVDTVWVAKKIEIPVETKVVTYRGKVTSSLWDSAISAKMDPNLTAELAEIFAWQVDFAREVQINDRWRLSVEQKFANGKAFGWGKILAAEYENAGQLYSAILFRRDGEDLGYFTPEGSSLRRMFLKSPIKYGRISSRFTRKRFHPILKVSRAHLGVDYAAPTGTPVRAVGDAVVTFAGRRGGAGKAILLRHNGVYKTAYKHLSGYASGVKTGARVRQGQVIGYVGSTGLSTGPHLHFEFYVNGSYVDPLGQKFPSADPVPANLMGQFKTGISTVLASLPDWEHVDVSMRTPAAEPEKEKESSRPF